MQERIFPYALTIGDVVDSTAVMHVNDFPRPIPIPIPFHQQGLILLTYYYYCTYEKYAANILGFRTLHYIKYRHTFTTCHVLNMLL